MTVYELEWVYTPWRKAGEAVAVSMSGDTRGRRTPWADAVALRGAVIGPIDWAWALGPGSSLRYWATRVPCWTPLRRARDGQATARTGTA